MSLFLGHHFRIHQKNPIKMIAFIKLRYKKFLERILLLLCLFSHAIAALLQLHILRISNVNPVIQICYITDEKITVRKNNYSKALTFFTLCHFFHP